MSQRRQHRASLCPVNLFTARPRGAQHHLHRTCGCGINPLCGALEESIGEQHRASGLRRQAARARPRRMTGLLPPQASRACSFFVYNFPGMVLFPTAGEPHGRALVVILEGIPAGLSIDPDAITADLRRRQGGYGRGRRMAIESDRAEILSGVRAGETIGGPIAMSIENRDWVNWQYTMRTTIEGPAEGGGARRAPVTKPRPGHADLAGVAKYGRADVRDILERASARETAARVAAGAVARQFLLRAGIRITSHVFQV